MGHICETCGIAFSVSTEEESLRAKIGALTPVHEFPAPRFCVTCRNRRLMSWRNERNLYRRKCDKTGKDIISVYTADAPFPVYERSSWYSDNWDASDYAQEIDFHRPFFPQFKELQSNVPRSALNGKNTENCDYCNFAFDTRNCYLAHCSYFSESLFYCFWMLECRDCYDCSFCFKCEQCLDCTDCNESYGCQHCTLCTNCSDSHFLYDCRGCTHCFGCVGLRKRSYCLFNEQLTKEKYEANIKQFDLQNPDHAAAVQERVAELRHMHPHRHSIQEKCEDSTGDFLFENKHCVNCYQMFRSRDCINCSDADGNTDLLDSYHTGWSELLYSGYSPVRLKTSAFFVQCWDGTNLLYCDNCQNCHDCFGCIGLQRKNHCILNKQYTEEEYAALLPKLVAHMKHTREWGEFFPPSVSPFAYNESVIPEYYPLSKEEAVKQGWKWQDNLPFTTGKETAAWDAIPKRIEDVPDSILKEVFACGLCNRNYRFIQQELAYYRERHLPLPHVCPECRHLQRIGLRNPRQLYVRGCAKCGKDMETTYAPDRPEIVYCEECYLATVY